VSRVGTWLHRTLVRADLPPEADLLVLDTTTMARGTNLGRYLVGSAPHRRFLIGYGVFLASVFVAGGVVALGFAVSWASAASWVPSLLVGLLGVGLVGFALYQLAGVRVMWRHRDSPAAPVPGADARPPARR
jgi:hypothetical protein